MNALSFISLLREIFRKEKPDLNRIVEKGLLAVKIGQMFALRVDFLKPETCAHLGRLYQHNPELPSGDFFNLLSRTVDEGWRNAFEMIEDKPLATASVAQVHRGRLKTAGAGHDVVVKLIKADVADQFQRDVEHVLRLFRFIIFFYPKLRRVANPLALLEMIRQDTLAELDFLNEIKHQAILREIVEKYGREVDLKGLGFPRMFPDYCNSRVLVMEEIQGPSINDLLERGALDYSLLLRLFHLHGFYIFGTGIFHGDIHPGNILLRDGVFYLIDCGALARVSERLRSGLFHFMKNLAWYRFDKCAECLHRMSEKTIDPERFLAFRRRLLDLYEDFPGKTVSQISLTRQMMYTIRLGVDYGMEFGEGMFPVIKSLMYLDGMILRCNPDAVLMEDMRANVAELEPYVPH